jgi:YNFM family putative membrane transporter
LLSTALFWALLPPSRRFIPRAGLGFAQHRKALFSHFGQRGLPWLFLMAFLLMGSFVTLYNYVGYRLLAPPYGLSQSFIGAIFVVYLLGTVTSPFSGRLADQFGRGRVLGGGIVIMLAGVLLTLLQPLAPIVAGIALITVGFFAGHSVASAWVGRLAKQAKGQAAALYLLAYYLGSSLVGSYGGHFWARGGWPGVVMLVGALLVLALAVAIRLARYESATTPHS